MKKLLGKFLTISFFLSFTSVNATTFTVSNLNNSGAGSLRQAINDANNDLTATQSARHIIDASSLSGTISITSALPQIQNYVDINGPSNSLLTISRTGSLEYGIFFIYNSTFPALNLKVTLNNLAIQNGAGSGGGVKCLNSRVTINNCVIAQNSTTNAIAPGIFTESCILIVNNSTINNNSNLGGLGGGVYVTGTDSATFNNCTIANNSASVGGGIDVNSNAHVSLNNCTVAGNNASSGGGIYVNIDDVELNNTIVSNNTATLAVNGFDIFKELSFGIGGGPEGVMSTNGHNLIGSLVGFQFVTGTNLTGNVVPLIISNVVSSSLINNGGITPTLALLPCSPAIDAGTSIGAPLLDQRGVARVNATDIGAYEYPALIVSDQSACGPTNFSVPVTGGTSVAPFYNWFNVPTGGTAIATGSPFISGILNQTDTFYVQEAASCANPKRYPVILTVHPLPVKPTINVIGYPANTASLQLCNNGPTVSLVSSPIATDNYLWTPTLETNDTIVTSAGGKYVVKVTDIFGCSTISDSLEIISISPPNTPTITSSIVNGSFICATDTATLNAITTSLPIAHYEWFLNSSLANDTTNSIEAVNQGDYVIIVSSGPNCTAASVPFTINQNPLPTKPNVTVTGATTFCLGNTVLLANSDLTNSTLWSVSGETTNSINADTTGNYFATITDGNGCKNYSDTISVTVNIPTIPIITITNNHPTTFCAGDSIILTSSLSASYLWSNGATSQSITVFNSISDLSVTTTDINSCQATSDSLQITVIPITTPIITANTATTFCQGGSVTLTSDQATGNTWFPNGETSNSITINSTDTFYVTIPGCSDSSNVVIVTVNPNPAVPTITADGPTTFCQGDNVILISSSINNNSWSPSGSNDSLVVTNSGIYHVTVSNSFGCTSQSTDINVVVNSLPISPVITPSGPLTFCQGGSVVLTSNNPTNNLWSNGSITQSISVTQSNPSIYLQVGDANNCLSLTSDTISVLVNIPVIPTITAVGPLIFCAGDSVLLISSSTTGNLWSNGLTNDSIYVNSTNSVTLTVTDANNCSATSLPTDVTVNQIIQPIIISNGSNSFCVGGSIQLESTAPTGNIWSINGVVQNSLTSSIITVTTSGIYTVQVAGCSAPSPALTVSVNPLPNQPQIIANGPSTVCQGEVVNLLSSSNTGLLWSNNAITQSIFVTSGGAYTVTTTDANGCSNTSLPFNVTINPLPAIPVITTNTGLNEFCQGGSIQLISSYSSNNVWSNGSTSNSISVANPGTFTVTHTNVNGCSSTSANKVINSVAPFTPTITIVGNDTICQGGSVTLISSELVGNVWSTGETTQSITIINPGSYSVSIESCGLPSDTLNIIVNPLPTAPIISANGPTTFCNGDSVELASNIPNVVWSNSTIPSQNIYALNAGNYFAVVTDANGCSNTSNSISVNIINQPSINLGANQTQCGGLVTLNAGNPGSTYLWDTPTADTTQIVQVGSGSYSVIVSNSCGVDTSNIVIVTINPIPSVDLGVDSAQCGGSITLDAGNAGATFDWNNGQGSNQLFTATNTGNYSVVVTNSFNCSSSDTIAINVDGQLPIVSIGPDITQCGGTANLNVGNVGTSYSWNALGNPTVLGTNQTLNVSTSGNYIATVTNACGSNTDTVNVVINANPIVNLGNDITQCNGTVNLTAGNSGSTFLWNDSQASTTASISVSISGDYSVIVTNSFGCTSTDSINVTINNNIPIVNLGPTVNQCGGSVTLDAGNPGSTYTWLLGSGNTATTQQIIVTASGNYKVIVNNGCGSVIDSIIINILAVPSVQLAGPYNVCDATVALVAGPSNSTNNYNWTLQGSSTSLSTNPSFTATTTGDYVVVITNSNNCSTSDTANVIINSSPVVNLGGPFSQCGGTVTLDAQNAGSNYLWNTPTAETTQTVSISTVGVNTFTVSVTNSCGTTAASAQVEIKAIPVVNLGNDTSICAGTSITLDANNTGANFSWTPGNQSSQTITVNTAGNYSVTVTDNGCSASDSKLVSIANPLSAINLGAPIATCGTNVTLDAGSFSSATYQWFDGTVQISNATNQTYTATISGAYSVVVANSCGSVTSSTANVTINPVPTANIGGPYSVCGSTTLSAGSQPANTTYIWYNSLGPISPAATNNTYIASVTESYSVLITNSDGCTASDTTNVTIQNTITSIPLVAPAPSCGSVIVNAGTYPSGTTYQWFDGNNVNQNNNLNSFTITQSGSYYLTASNTCNSITSNTINVVIQTIPTVNLGGPFNQCGGVTLTAGTQLAGSTYVWSNNSVVIPNATANNYNAVINGNYSVLVTTSAGCSNSDTVSVNTALGAPVVILPPTISGCGSVNLDAGNPNSSYLWSPSGQTTQQISVSTANTYSVVVTNACGSSTGSTTVSINPSVTVPVVTNSGPTSFCAGGSVTITSSSAPAGGTYLWNTGATTQSISVNQTGNYFVTITNNQSCSATSAVTQVNVGSALPTPIITASGPTSFCPGGSVTLTSSYTSGNKWSPNNEQTQSITVFFSGSYTVSVTDAAGCVSTSAPTIVTVLTPPVALITANQPPLVCAGETIKLWADTAATASNVWNLSGAGATTDSITFTAQTGTVSYSVTATSTDGCTATSPVYTFTYIPSVNKPTITSSNSGAKCDGTITLTSSENTGNIWFNGATTQSITITTTERVWVKVRNAAGCEKTSDTTWFAATAGAPITITKDVEIYIPGNFNISEFGKKDGSINLTAVGGVAPLSFNWSGATTSTSEDLTNLGAGIYYLKVSDIVGCEVLDTIILKEPKEFKLPTGFSPNNDGKNDAYIIGAIEKYPDNKVEIFNRWGSVVWSIEGYNNADKIWNGTNNSGTDLPEGTYYVVVTFPNGNVETLKNYIDLKR